MKPGFHARRERDVEVARERLARLRAALDADERALDAGDVLGACAHLERLALADTGRRDPEVVLGAAIVHAVVLARRRLRRLVKTPRGVTPRKPENIAEVVRWLVWDEAAIALDGVSDDLLVDAVLARPSADGSIIALAKAAGVELTRAKIDEHGRGVR